MSSWRTALRIARREARRAKGRSALVVALIGLPVLGVTFAAVTYDMTNLTPQERVARDLGAADAKLTWFSDQPVRQLDVEGWELATTEPPADADRDLRSAVPTAAEIRELLPPSSRVVPIAQGSVRLATATGVGGLEGRALDLSDPLFAGMLTVTGGRAPAAPDEVAVNAPAAARLGVAVGDEIENADTAERYRVVSTVEDPSELRFRELVLFHPDAPAAALFGPEWLVDTPEPVSWDQVTALNQHGFTVYSRAVALDPPAELLQLQTARVDGPTPGVGLLVAGLVILEIVLLAGPAFAVGARARQRSLALVAANGGRPAQLRRIVLADGVVLGTLGAAAGLVLGILAAFAARPLVEVFLFGQRAGGYRVFPLALVAIVVVAIGTGVLAALVPAVTAARQQVVTALAGRRGSTGTRKRWLVLGLALVGAGAVVAGAGAWRVNASLVLAGLVIGQLGLVLCTPAIVGLVARLGSRLTLAPRIALRDTARNRSAAAPAISAVMAAVAGAAAAGVIMISNAERDAGAGWWNYPPGTVEVNGVWELGDGSDDEVAALADAERAARALLPVDQVHHLSMAFCAGPDDEDDQVGPVAVLNQRDGGCDVVAVVPEEDRCPFWRAPLPLTPADQRTAKEDPRCDSDVEPQGTIWAVADDANALSILTGADPGSLAPAEAVLQAGGVVVTDEALLGDDGSVELHWTSFNSERTTVIQVPGYLVPAGSREPIVVASSGVVDQLGMTTVPGPLVMSTTTMPTVAAADAFDAAMQARDGFSYVVREESGGGTPMLMVLAAAAAVIALGAAGIATGLAAADRRPDLATLGAVGASPRVRRRLSLSQSGVIAGLGTVLGLVAGLGAAVAVLVALNQRYASIWPEPDPYPIMVPWQLLAALLAVPIVAMLGAGLLSRSRLPIERRLT